MAEDVFDVLAKKLEQLPDEVAEAYKQASIKAINEAGDKLNVNLTRTSPSERLKNHLLPPKVTTTKFAHTYEVDWSNELVNPSATPRIERKRKAGKRDYGVAPATWHDLAYILDAGVRSDETGNTIKPPTNFIKKAWRNAKTWKKKRDRYFDTKLAELGEQFDDFKTYSKPKE